jgi:hypothetical protein
MADFNFLPVFLRFCIHDARSGHRFDGENAKEQERCLATKAMQGPRLSRYI